ncbi:hypothetical protein [Alicyclobacillus sp. SO9]|uniref:hypothetical protein n=1 Tax=Alicyclobacillus sp. SO9 TaxID=2665646 RepID=UPI0018E81162|nr:hypothetical protein [Alicyclobacillus sp. SO9]QQE79112.1 hypothetical protein GI364_00895 [Alicyclobacillus sp. SO9]
MLGCWVAGLLGALGALGDAGGGDKATAEVWDRRAKASGASAGAGGLEPEASAGAGGLGNRDPRSAYRLKSGSDHPNKLLRQAYF